MTLKKGSYLSLSGSDRSARNHGKSTLDSHRMNYISQDAKTLDIATVSTATD